MAVFRIERTRDYTVMSNHHLRNVALSLKAKGLLSMMLSLPDDWNYTTRGLAKICKEGVDAIGGALRELEREGYIVRHQLRDAQGRISDTEYVIYEQPQSKKPDIPSPDTAAPDTDSPGTENPYLDKPDTEKPAELNIEQLNTQKPNTQGSSIDSIPFRETTAGKPPERKGRDAMSMVEMQNYRELILENIEYDHLRRQFATYREDLDEIVELIVETVCARRKTTRITDGGPQQLSFIPEGDVYRLIVHSRLPSAERFERWVFDEVLPSIRRHGAYITPEMLWEVATTPEALMKLCSDLLAEREKNSVLLEANAQLQGKAFYFDAFIKAGRCTNLRITAKELEVPERRFVRFLLNERFVYRSPSGCVLPYAKPENEGLFCVKDFYSNGYLGAYTLVTPEGKRLFATLRDQILMTV